MVEEGSILKAAERVYRTQPAVSIALRKLENDVCSPLFDRTKRHEYQLTPEGELFYDYATRILSLRNEAVAALADFASMRRGRLRVGANESISLHLLPKVTHLFHQKYPGVKIEVTSDHSERLLRKVKDLRLDLALIANSPEDREFEVRFIMHDELVLIVSPGHRLARERCVRLQDLGAESVIVESASSSLRERVSEAFDRLEIPLNISVESATIETIKKMVAMGQGVAFVPLMCVQEEKARGELIVVPVEGFRHERKLWLVRRQNGAPSHAARAFVEVIDRFAEALRREQP